MPGLQPVPGLPEKRALGTVFLWLLGLQLSCQLCSCLSHTLCPRLSAHYDSAIFCSQVVIGYGSCKQSSLNVQLLPESVSPLGFSCFFMIYVSMPGETTFIM